MESKTYKLLRSIAYLMFAAGAIVFLYALFGMRDYVGELMTGAVPVMFGGLMGGTIWGAVFLFFAKVVEQNEERYKQAQDVKSLLNRIDTRIEKA